MPGVGIRRALGHHFTRGIVGITLPPLTKKPATTGHILQPETGSYKQALRRSVPHDNSTRFLETLQALRGVHPHPIGNQTLYRSRNFLSENPHFISVLTALKPPLRDECSHSLQADFHGHHDGAALLSLTVAALSFSR